MKYRILQKVKDSHRIAVSDEKGMRVIPSVILFKEGQVVTADSQPELPKERLEKLVDYGYAEHVG